MAASLLRWLAQPQRSRTSIARRLARCALLIGVLSEGSEAQLSAGVNAKLRADVAPIALDDRQRDRSMQRGLPWQQHATVHWAYDIRFRAAGD
jgi:hypothetical protein